MSLFDRLTTRAERRIAQNRHLAEEVVADQLYSPESVRLRVQEAVDRQQYLRAYLYDCMLQLRNEDTIPEAPEDSDIGRTMKQWAAAHDVPVIDLSIPPMDVMDLKGPPPFVTPRAWREALREYERGTWGELTTEQRYARLKDQAERIALADVMGMPTLDPRADERDEANREMPVLTAPIGYYDCPTCGAHYEGPDLPTVKELIGWLQSSVCGNPGCQTDPEWRVEWFCDVTAPTARDAALIAQQRMQDPENTAKCFDVLPWRNWEVHRGEGVFVDLTSDVPPAMPDDSQWVPGL
jgi:hypothetical protein